MTPVTQLAQFLLRLDPPKNLARLTFYHYVKNWLEPQSPLSLENLDAFFDRCLAFEYWQNNRTLLGSTVLEDLGHFYRGQQGVPDFNQVVLPENRQTLKLDHVKDLESLIKIRSTSQKQAGDETRIVALGDHQVMVLKLLDLGKGLEVFVYRNDVKVLDGELVPFPPVTQLFYGPQLDLSHNKRMLIEGPLMSSFIFNVDNNGIRGYISRGHSFQKIDSFSGAYPSTQPELFYALKRVEKHFIKPQGDPFYQELVSLLEKSYQLISTGEPHSESLAETAVTKGRVALKNIFPGDKLLLLLITNIEYWLVQRKNSRGLEKPAISRRLEKPPWQNDHNKI